MKMNKKHFICLQVIIYDISVIMYQRCYLKYKNYIMDL